MHTGTVKFFDASPNKQFGFITHNGSEVFFHQTFGGMMACLGGEVPVFVKCQLTRIPKKDDTILFESVNGKKGYRATQWCFPESLQQALDQINARPLYKLVERRGFIMHTRLHNDAKAKYVILWEGKNLEELRTKFPANEYPIEESDQFARYFKLATADGKVLDYSGDPRI